MILWDAITLAAENFEGRQRLTLNLHKLATRAIFLLATPDEISNKDLLDILSWEAPGTHKSKDNASLVRHYRQLGNERTLKIESARHLIVRLLNGDFVAKSDAVRLWYYVVIHYVAAQAAISERKGEILPPRSNDGIAYHRNALMDYAHASFAKLTDEYLARSIRLYQDGVRFADREYFLDAAVLGYFRTSATARNPIATYRALWQLAKTHDAFSFE